MLLPLLKPTVGSNTVSFSRKRHVLGEIAPGGLPLQVLVQAVGSAVRLAVVFGGDEGAGAGVGGSSGGGNPPGDTNASRTE